MLLRGRAPARAAYGVNCPSRMMAGKEHCHNGRDRAGARRTQGRMWSGAGGAEMIVGTEHRRDSRDGAGGGGPPRVCVHIHTHTAKPFPVKNNSDPHKNIKTKKKERKELPILTRLMNKIQ